MKRLALVILTALTLGVTGSASAQFGRNYWYLDADTLKVINPNWFIAAQNFIPIVGGTTNLFLGYQSGYSITSGIFNVGLGYRSLYSVTSGSFNTAIGDSAMLFDSVGTYNVAIGHKVLYQNSGDWNVGIGQGALENNGPGAQNVGIGYLALNLNSTGYAEVAIGTGAMYNTNGGTGNVSIGNYAAASVSGNLNIAIGQNALYEGGAQADSNIAIGAFSLYSLGNGSASNGNVAIGGHSGGGLFLGYDNVMLGNDVADYLNYGNNNIAIGDYALYGTASATAYSYSNVSIGDSSLFYARNSLYNVALGHFAGFYDSTGTGNIFLGDSSGYNETGSNKLYIANSSTSSPLIYGDFTGDSLRVNGQLSASGNIMGYGNATLSGNLSVNGTGTNSFSGLINVTKAGSQFTFGSAAGQGDITATTTLAVIGWGFSINNSSQYVASQNNAVGMLTAYDGSTRWIANGGLTSGNVFSPTELMRLTLAGNLLIGTSSDGGQRLQVSGTGYISGNTTIGGNLKVNGTGVDTLAGMLNTGGYISTASNFSTTSSTLANVPGLSVAVPAAGNYAFEANLFETVATSAGEKFTVIFSGTSSHAIFDVVATTSTTGQSVSNWTTTLGTAISTTSSNVNSSANIRGTITATSAGTITIQYAQNTAQATANVVQQGSTMRVWQTN